ncbi:GDP-mannose 4,6-dehydratase [Mammaliicoccus sciuri]|uniref:GDP-mannose 4,6-dehydratase n=1 Tax=Mammaliicoccus sciuri TaxID=1296 RepID=UPI000473FCE4|nr:NAD-dependent epimerase/dehydratase family protein [Mammaliicoccus sciuri]
MERILIIGGAGFIGSNLAEELYKDFDVYVIDNYRTGKRENLWFLDSSNIFNVDILDKKSIADIFKKIKFDYVVHLAALVSVAESIENPLLSNELNSVATLNLLETIKVYNKEIKKFVFASSAAVYGNLEELPKKIQSPVMPLTPYANDKYFGERTTVNYYNLYNIPTVVTRFFNVFGPRQDPKSPYSGFISKVFDSFENNKSFTFYGDGLQSRDFIYISDVVEAIKLAMLNPNTNGNVYNVGTGKDIDLISVFKIINSLYNKNIEVEFKEERLGDIRHSYADIKELKELGFTPKHSINHALRKYFEFYGAKVK